MTDIRHRAANLRQQGLPCRHRRKRLPGFVVTWCLPLIFASQVAAQARSITVAWDPNPESNVAGYVVYVGTSSGHYTEAHDVGTQTSFTYHAARAGRTYYFSVAAYAPRYISGRSLEVSSGPDSVAPSACTADMRVSGACGAARTPGPGSVFESGGAVPRNDTTSHTSNSSASFEDSSLSGTSSTRSLGSTPVPAPPASGLPTTVCGTLSPADCLNVEPAAYAGDPRALAATPDGRVFVLDQGNAIRVMGPEPGQILPVPALVITRSGVELKGIVLDPVFATSHLVYVSQVEQGREGRALTIVRYREVVNRFGEPSAVVVGLPLPAVGNAQIALDASGHIYVAMPATSSRDPYQNAILRFNADGTTPADNVGMSPVFARGLASPLSLTWNSSSRELQLTGRDADRNPVTGWLTPAPRSTTSAGGVLREPTFHVLGAQYASMNSTGDTSSGASSSVWVPVGSDVYRIEMNTAPRLPSDVYDFGALGDVSAVTPTSSGNALAIVTSPSGARRLVTLRAQTR